MATFFNYIFIITGLIGIFTLVLWIVALILKEYRDEAKTYLKATVYLVIISVIAFIISKII